MNSTNRKQNVLAIIPARGGSKGIPRKNIRNLCGKPLIAYTIEAATHTRLIDRVMVSTDDEEIAEMSRDYGAEIPFMRPKELAHDRSGVGHAVNFTLHSLNAQGYIPDIVVTLFPTHPFRTAGLIDFLTGKALKGHSKVISVKAVSHNNLSLFSKNDDHLLLPLLSRTNSPESSAATFFRRTGHYIGTNQGSDGPPFIHLIRDPVALVDIDEFSDFFLAEEIIQNRLFHFDWECSLDSDNSCLSTK